MAPGRLAACLSCLFLAAVWLAPRAVSAQAVRPRFIVVFDTSGSMSESAGRVRTHGDGSSTHPGCDLDGNGRYDDSKLFQAKAALRETITAFGSAEFALARYHQEELGQACGSDASCITLGLGANQCVAGQCGYVIPPQSPDYNECTGGLAQTNGCIRCADPANDPTHVFYNGNLCCAQGGPTSGGAGMAGDVLVSFPEGVGRNDQALLSWMDGEEDFPVGDNRELRAVGITPIGASLNAVRDWLTRENSPAGPGGGLLGRDSKVDCRSYNVILITDGIETDTCITNCGINGALAADGLYHSCSDGGVWDPLDERCEIAGDPANTRRIRVRTYVVGFTVNDASLNSIAAAGGTGTALLANNQAELTARLGDIVAASIPRESCDCADNTCDDEIDETFARKGQVCTVGVGRCKRQGVFACAPDGSDVVCSSSPAGICPGTALTPGAPATEQCGAAPGCLAPTPEDCADDDCDGITDENLSCACAQKPEVCNGADDDCNGVVDDVGMTACGLDIGECKPGRIRCAPDGGALCEGGTAPSAELCDGRDNDCDGITDGFGLSCYPGGQGGCALNVSPLSCGAASPDAWTCTGICQTGVLTCDGGQCGACRGAVTPHTELACDGLDNDCDGQTDEGFGLGGACGAGAGKPGACRAGVLVCGNNQLVCQGGQGPEDETCNGSDDDCDGVVDNIPGPCGFTDGECVPGRWICQGTTPVCDQLVGPQPELCDGRDNDCDGVTDENPTDPDLRTETACGSDEGVCSRGTLACIGGGKVCTNSIEPILERCNALDDDCDGDTDEGINSPGDCPPPGLAPGAAVAGECRPGVNTCAADGQGGATWMCMGGVGPMPEICDGKDNDCDARIDDEAPCPAGFTCAMGECAPLCRQGEFQCPADRTCQDGVCLRHPCVRNPCPHGFYCDAKLGCIDRCADVECPAGYSCDNGMCTSCQTTGCPAGQLCRVSRCEPDPCAGVSCPGTGYCRDGTCVASCNGVACSSRDEQLCRDGQCRVDLCADEICNNGEFCRPATGACEPDPCRFIACLPGEVCVPAPGECVSTAGAACAPTAARCLPDPCQVTACRGDDVCFVHPDGVAECLSRDRVPRPAVVRIAAGGSGCACALDPGQDGGSPATALGLLVLALAGWRRRMRTRRSP